MKQHFYLIRERFETDELISLFLSNPEEIKTELGKDTTNQLYIRLMTMRG
jgi:hypothetical protein